MAAPILRLAYDHLSPTLGLVVFGSKVPFGDLFAFFGVGDVGLGLLLRVILFLFFLFRFLGARIDRVL